jgi:hypothetical protein
VERLQQKILILEKSQREEREKNNTEKDEMKKEIVKL